VGVQFDNGVIVGEIVEALGAEQESGHHLAGVQGLPLAIDDAHVNQIDHAV